MTLTTLGYAFIGGLLPALFWLYFLLKEDARCPEPRELVALAFVGGMIAVPLALPFEHFAKAHLTGMFAIFTAWALVEEVLKYALAAGLVLWRRAVNEGPDYVIYMVTAALGFAAAENALFLVAPLSGNDFAGTFLTGNIRFIGSTLLHVVASACIGFALAFSARGTPIVRTLAASAGLILAVALHTSFNLLIMETSTSAALFACFLVWMVLVVFFAAFEMLKYFQYRSLSKNTCPS